MKYYVIAGEVSGDIHGANLIHSIKSLDDSAEIRFWGGDNMVSAGGTLVKHVKDLAFMGFWEVVTNFRTILGFLSDCKKDIINFQPDVIVLIDYPGFNLRIAKWATLHGFRVAYYIVPQVWAWHKSRVKLLKAYTNQLIAILPFETAFYEKNGCKVEYVGHPLLDEIKKQLIPVEGMPEFDLALLAGSRKQEIQKMLPVFLEAAEKLGLQCAIAASPNIPPPFYQEIITKAGLQKASVELYYNRMYAILQKSKFAFVTSGTATLETALWNVPQIVAYQGSKISYWIARKLVTLSYISLVNLILDRKLVTELIQDDLTAENLVKQYRADIQHQSFMLEGYLELRQKLGNAGASSRAAKIIYDLAGQS